MMLAVGVLPPGLYWNHDRQTAAALFGSGVRRIGDHFFHRGAGDQVGAEFWFRKIKTAAVFVFMQCWKLKAGRWEIEIDRKAGDGPRVLARKAKRLSDVARYDIKLIEELPTIFLDQF
jgi:hypothetical protein